VQKIAMVECKFMKKKIFDASIESAHNHSLCFLLSGACSVKSRILVFVKALNTQVLGVSQFSLAFLDFKFGASLTW
jgi:uncharacterized protein (UPF0264 family)